MEDHPLMSYGDLHVSKAYHEGNQFFIISFSQLNSSLFWQTLEIALLKRDIKAFRQTLQSPSDVEKHYSENELSLFEQACQTPGCAAFIEECIRVGCDVNKVVCYW